MESPHFFTHNMSQDLPLKNKPVRLYRSAPDMASTLNAIYVDMSSGGVNYKMRLSRTSFRVICGHKRVSDTYIAEVSQCLLDEHGLYLAYLDSTFALIPVDFIMNFRRITKSVIAEHNLNPDFDSNDDD